ncbi:GTP-binding protein [Methanocalculus chunghsingensis]|uniref:GTP-binding protein n=2 Tax=Methanocalculus chunghsingensis TaxID=156457 RepID=A0A8J7W9I7_9EURY|nr:GTPase [Methanocalculus chunghsingensis]MBR1368617.1 GTP-binding protein [Methanocalculus chunghsingensis]
MMFDTIPTVPTADEVLDRSFRRAAKKMRKKNNKDRANEEFVRAITQAVHDKLVAIIQSFPEFHTLPPFYRDLVDILFDIEEMRKAFGAVGWAAWHTRDKGKEIAKTMRHTPDSLAARKQAVARIASMVHQIDKDLRFLNDARNILRKLPVVSPDEFTVVIAGYPNVGKSSFIRLVSTATPEVASYPFTTKGVVVGHRQVTRRERIQFIDTPGILDTAGRTERNRIERQALNALIYVADLIIFIIDASAHCGYDLETQELLLEEVRELAKVPVIVVANKSDLARYEGVLNMSTVTGEGVEEVLEAALKERTPTTTPIPAYTLPENQE